MFFDPSASLESSLRVIEGIQKLLHYCKSRAHLHLLLQGQQLTDGQQAGKQIHAVHGSEFLHILSPWVSFPDHLLIVPLDFFSDFPHLMLAHNHVVVSHSVNPPQAPATTAIPVTTSSRPASNLVLFCSGIAIPATTSSHPASNLTFDAYVVGKEDAPGIVVLQEWWGVDFEVKNHALHISKLNSGYKALIPDLYRGKVGLDVAEAQHLMDDLDWPGAVKDISASVNWLKANGSKKVGVTGYCMGGALSIASSVLVPEVDAVVAFYGVPSPQLADPSQAKAPVQAHFGELDNFVGFADVTSHPPSSSGCGPVETGLTAAINRAAKSLEEKLKASGVPHEVHIYPGCAHAFMNASPEGIQRRKKMGMDDENKEAVDLAWSHFSSWMGRYLSA
ncbi:hypothetical protein ACLOJK_019745 [Asimina triloba]